MKLGELRSAIDRVTDEGSGGSLNIKLRDDAEVVVAGDNCWLRAVSLEATFLRGRWTLLMRTAKPGDPMWEEGTGGQ